MIGAVYDPIMFPRYMAWLQTMPLWLGGLVSFVLVGLCGLGMYAIRRWEKRGEADERKTSNKE